MALTAIVNCRFNGPVGIAAMEERFEEVRQGTAGSVTWESTEGGRYRFVGATSQDGDKTVESRNDNWTVLVGWCCVPLKFLGLPSSTTDYHYLTIVVPTDGAQGANKKVFVAIKYNSGASQWRFGLADNDGNFFELDGVNVETNKLYFVEYKAKNVAGDGQNETQALYVWDQYGNLLDSMTQVIDQSGTFISRIVKVGLQGGGGKNSSGLDWVSYGVLYYADDESGGETVPGPLWPGVYIPASVDLDEGFTPNTGDEVSAVTETLSGTTGHNGDTTYIDNGTQTSQHVIRYALTAPSLPSGTQVKSVRGTSVHVNSRFTGSAPTQHQGLRSGTSENVGDANVAIGSAYRDRAREITNDPATSSPWTKSALDAAKIVVKDADTQNRNFRTTWVGVTAALELEPIDQTISGAGNIASAGAFGSPTVTLGSGSQTISGVGAISSSESFGGSKLNLRLFSGAVSSSELFGSPTVGGFITISPNGITSGESFGTTAVSRGSITISLTGIASSMAFGATTVSVLGDTTGAIVLSRDLGRPVLSWSVTEDLSGGAIQYSAQFVEQAAGATRKASETLINGAKDDDIFRINVVVSENGVEQEEQLLEGLVETYGVKDPESNTPVFSIAGFDATKGKLRRFHPNEPVTYQGRPVNSSGVLQDQLPGGGALWTFQTVAKDICNRAGIVGIRFFCPNFKLGNDLVWSVDMSADDALTWLLSNGGMRATEKHHTDLYPVRESGGWYLYFVRRSSVNSVVTEVWNKRKVVRDVTRRRPDSHWWPSIQVLGMSYQVTVPIPQDPAGLGNPYVQNMDPEESFDWLEQMISRKYNWRKYFYADGREYFEVYDYIEYDTITLSNGYVQVNYASWITKHGETTWTYDPLTKKETNERFIEKAYTSSGTLGGDIIVDRETKTKYETIVTPQGQLALILSNRSTTERQVDIRSLVPGSVVPVLETVMVETLEVTKSGFQFRKKATRRTIDPKTGKTTLSGSTTDLTAADYIAPTTVNPPGTKQETQELKSGPDNAVRKLRFPAIGEQAWLDQVLGDVEDEANSWVHEGTFTVVPRLGVRGGMTLSWLEAPARWFVSAFYIVNRTIKRNQNGSLSLVVTGKAWTT